MSENSIYCAPSRGPQEFCVHRVIHKSGASSCSDRVGWRPWATTSQPGRPARFENICT
jgi:hypothetical protein